MKREAGFSLIELLVASVIMLIVLTMVYVAFIETRKLALRNEMDAEITQYARIGLDEMARQIRMIGYHIDTSNGQPAIIEAAPFQLTFNADIDANFKAISATTIIRRYDGSKYKVPMTYATGAETTRWTLDSTDNGIVDKRDLKDNQEELNTVWNLRDMALIKEVNGFDRQITLNLLGPLDENNERTNIPPMFQYWLYTKPPCVPQEQDVLWGDCNDNGVLDGDEIYFPPITSVLLHSVRRIQITVTAESDRYDPLEPSQHRRVTLSTEVSLRNYKDTEVGKCLDCCGKSTP